MERSEDYELLLRSKDEIVDLRRRNEVLQAQVDVMNIFDRAIRAQFSQGSISYGEDLAWRIENRLREIENPQQQGRA